MAVARCAVRAAFSGASTGWTDSRDKRSARCTRAGTPPRGVPTV